MPNPYYDDDDDGHESTDEYASRPKYPKHGPHGARPPPGTCHRFPYQSYMAEQALCGADNLEVDGIYGFTHVRCPWASPTPCSCGRQSLHLNSLVVAVDGACPGNGTQHATKSACGVFFAPDSPNNLAFRVPDTPGYLHTSQRAELNAALAAVRASRTFIHNGGQWKCEGCPTPCVVIHLVIKTDSAYLVNGMTAHVEKWRLNGWRTAKDTEVKNRDLWTKLDDLVHGLHDETGVTIDFWQVPRDQNTDADELANLGLRRHYLGKLP